MPATIKVTFDLTDGSWADLHDPEKCPTPENPKPLRDNVEWLGADKTELMIGRLPGGMRDSNNAAVIIRANRPDGSTVLIETSLSCFVETAKVMNSLDIAEKQATAALQNIAKPANGGH